jgi:hypothetical protein
MRRSSFLITALSAIFVCGLIYAQDATEEENLEYEKLKVLEPLIGTWQIEWTNDETGVKGQAKVEISWSETKKMVRQKQFMRTAEPGADLVEQEWNARADRCYLWNHNTKRIEQVNINERSGWVITREVKPSGGGVFVMPAISGSNEVTGDRILVTYKVEKDSHTVTLSNRTDDEGNPRDDFVYTMQRVKDGE